MNTALQCYSSLSECMEKQTRWAKAAVCRDRQHQLAVEVENVEEQAKALQGSGVVCTKQDRYKYVSDVIMH